MDKTWSDYCQAIGCEMRTELWIAREMLSSRYHRDDGTNVPSWNDYCEEIGVTRQNVNRWLQATSTTHLRPETGIEGGAA